MSYDFEMYNDGEPFDFRQEKWMEEALNEAGNHSQATSGRNVLGL